MPGRKTGTPAFDGIDHMNFVSHLQKPVQPPGAPIRGPFPTASGHAATVDQNHRWFFIARLGNEILRIRVFDGEMTLGINFELRRAGEVDQLGLALGHLDDPPPGGVGPEISQ